MKNPSFWGESYEQMTLWIAEATGDNSALRKWDTQDWVNLGYIPKEYRELPNAVEALKILSSPLYEALNKDTKKHEEEND